MNDHRGLIEEARAACQDGATLAMSEEQIQHLYARLAAALEQAEKANQFLAKDAYDSGRLAERLADDALIALAGAHVGTPVEGYLKAPYCLKSDIHDLAKARDEAERRADAAERAEKAGLVQNESLLTRLVTEREEHREMFQRQAKAVRHHTERADKAERRVAGLEAESEQLATNVLAARQERADMERRAVRAERDLAALAAEHG